MADSASMTEPTNNNPQLIIPHRPVSDDKFKGAHDKIADALEKIITNPDQEGISIGLEGARGSGKSTILNILQKNISADKKHSDDVVFATIDTWSHGGDQLRRASLEVIVEAFVKKRWINKNDWQPKFLGSDKEQSKPPSSALFLALILTLAIWILIPESGQKVLLQPFRPLTQLLVPEWLTMPAFFITLAVIIYFIRYEVRDRILRLFRVFFNSEVDSKIDTAMHQVEESSWLFQKWFRRVAKNALKSKSRKLVIIFDNLDRLDVDQASAAIQALQVFLEDLMENRTEGGWRSRVFFICCYSKAELKERVLYPTENEFYNSSSPKQVYADKSAIKEHFEKIFNVQFRTPSLTPDMWQDHVMKVFSNRGFKDYEINEIKMLLQQAYINKPPTPRELETCANELIALRLQISDEKITNLELLEYWLWAKDKDDILSSLVQWHLLKNPYNPSERQLVDVDMVKAYASYFLGKPEKEAYQALISDPIRNALNIRKKPEELMRLAKNAFGYERVFSAELKRLLDLKLSAGNVLEVINFLYGREEIAEAHANNFYQFEDVFPLLDLELMQGKDTAELYVRAIKLILDWPDNKHQLDDVLAIENGWVIGGDEESNRANSGCWFWFHRALLTELSGEISNEQKFILAGDTTQCHEVLNKLYELWENNRELGDQLISRITTELSGMEFLEDWPCTDWFLWMKDDYDGNVIKRILSRKYEDWTYDILDKRHKDPIIGDACRNYFRTNIHGSRENAVLAWDVSPKLRKIPKKLLKPIEQIFSVGHWGDIDRLKRVLEGAILDLEGLQKEMPDLNIVEILTEVAAKNPTLESPLRPLIEGLKGKIQ